MHIGIDVRDVCHGHTTGKGKWTAAFVRELAQRGIEITLFTDAPIPAEWQHMRTVRFPSGLRWHVRCAWYLLTTADVDFYVSPLSYIVPFLVGRRIKTVPIVHDLIAFIDRTHERKATYIERWTLPRALRSAHKICTVSASTKQDLLMRFPRIHSQKISVILAAATHDERAARSSDGRTILSIGTLSPRKNQLRLMHAFAALPVALRDTHRLVLVGGRGWNDDTIVHCAQESPCVEWKGRCSDAEVQILLSQACIFAYPSLYEGFGLPVLDAMKIGVPVLCSDRGSLAEVAGDAAVCIDPERVESIRDGLQQLLTDGTLRTHLSVAGMKRATLFSWKRTVDLFLAAL